MFFVCKLDDIQLNNQNLVGDKATYLGALLCAGFDVPPGFCITAEAYRDTFAAHVTNERIAARLEATEIDDPVDLESAADDIRAWIESAPMPNSVEQEIRNTLTSFGSNTTFAVRASRITDDVPNPAASGLQQAYLGVASADAVIRSVRQCWAAPWNSRAIYYRHRRKIAPAQVTMAVVIQPMQNADAAGVMFTANPLNGATDEIHIDSTFGLGEAVIAARWKPDHFVVAKNTLTIKSSTIANKSVMDIPALEGGLQTVSVPRDRQEMASLSDEQIHALATLGQKIEAEFKEPQDIEWCLVGERFWLLQTRPLKKIKKDR